jgi:hypothetical protein
MRGPKRGGLAALKGIALEIFIWPLGIPDTESKNENKQGKQNAL